MINVTKTFLPDFDEYCKVLKRAWDKAWITNNGELVQELEQKLKEYLGVKHLLYASNGTIVLQMALKAYGITKEVITTPFSYVATTNAILWERCTPVFVDINPLNFCIDADKIEESITENTQAILATHVFGLPCNVEKIQLLAEKYSLKVIYDGAHAFGCVYKGKSLLSYGDISTCSFHATKLFHTVEGGCIITDDDTIADKLKLFRSFGHIGDDYYSLGINAKNSEFHAAMGICNINALQTIITARTKISGWYDGFLKELDLHRPTIPADVLYNHAYYPVIFESEEVLTEVIYALKTEKISTRRYFYPSLNKLSFLTESTICKVSEDIAIRVLCLPLFHDLSKLDVEKICGIVHSVVNK